MKYNILGASGTAVSPICLGTMMFGGPTPDKEALRIIDHSLDHGVNFIDTADVYEKGRSEMANYLYANYYVPAEDAS